MTGGAIITNIFVDPIPREALGIESTKIFAIYLFPRFRLKAVTTYAQNPPRHFENVNYMFIYRCTNFGLVWLSAKRVKRESLWYKN